MGKREFISLREIGTRSWARARRVQEENSPQLSHIHFKISQIFFNIVKE